MDYLEYAELIVYSTVTRYLTFPSIWASIILGIMAQCIKLAVRVVQTNVEPDFWRKVEKRAKKALFVAQIFRDIATCLMCLMGLLFFIELVCLVTGLSDYEANVVCGLPPAAWPWRYPTKYRWVG